MIADLRGRAVLLVAVQPPLASALEEVFLRHGAACVQSEIAEFDAALENLRAEGRALDALVIGAAPKAPAVASLDEYNADALTRAVAGCAWPAFACLQRTRAVLGRYPRYAIALSSLDPDRFACGADFSAASEAVLETLCRFVNERLAAEDVRMNILRHRLVPASEVAGAAVALCSGLLDAMRGTVLTVDRGAGFGDNVFRLIERNGE